MIKHSSQLLDAEAETSSMRRASAALTRYAEDESARLAGTLAACSRVSANVAAREAALAASAERFGMLQMLHDSGELFPLPNDKRLALEMLPGIIGRPLHGFEEHRQVKCS